MCTSSNARTALDWAFEQVGGVDGDGKVLFLPDQHLGRNTAVRELGLSPRRLRRVGPAPPGRRPDAGAARGRADDPLARALLGARPLLRRRRRGGPPRDPRRQGHRPPRVPVTRSSSSPTRSGSTEKIIQTIAAGPGRHVVGRRHRAQPRRRLAQQFPEQRIAFLEKNVCYCSTMNRIDLPHLVWALESLVEGRVVNPIRVDATVAAEARAASTGCSRCPARPTRTDRRMAARRLDRIAVISDVHGNVTALEAVLADIEARGITRVLNLGDVVGKGPRGSEAIKLTRETCEVTVRGNWDTFIAPRRRPALRGRPVDARRADRRRHRSGLRPCPTRTTSS